jgi:Zn-dependent protease with chaperone function
MTAAARAAASVLMMIGFYLVALIQFVAVVALVVWVSTLSTAAIGIKVGLPLLFAVGATGVGLWRAIRTKPEELPGLILPPGTAAQLWQLVGGIAAEVGTRAPDEIRLVPAVNAMVSEEVKLLGLIGGRRRLYLGMPLMQTLTVDQLGAVLAHELGHYSGLHTRLGEVAYRGRLAIGGTISRIGPWNPVGWVFRGYARLYLLVDNAATRRQELDADRAAVRVAGPAAATAALRELPVLDAAWGFYHRAYVSSGWEAGYAPDDLFGGFGRLVAARRAELDALRAEEPESDASRWDTHPPVADRIAAIATAPQGTHAVDGRPASVLLPGIDTVGLQLQHEVVDVGTRLVLSWPEFTAKAIGAGQQRTADRVLRSVARRTGLSAPGLADVLDLVEAGRLGELAEEFFPDATGKEAAACFAALMDVLLTVAAVNSGAAHWQHSWSGPAQLVDAAGAPADFEDVAELAVSPETLAVARTRMAELGIRVEEARVVQAKATGVGSDVIGALANVRVEGMDADLFVLSSGLVFAPAPKKIDGGKGRLQEILSSNTAEQLAECHRFIPYEEMTAVTFSKRIPVQVQVTLHGGTTITVHERWTGELLGDSRDTLLTVLDRVADRATTS